MNPTANDLLTIARSAASLGADIMRATDPGHIEQKSDRDFVTEVDLRIQEEIRRYLHAATPGIKFLGEESDPSEIDLETVDAAWILDPIDGTSNFIHGLPLSAVSLALAQNGQPTIGVIVVPFLALEYHAAVGRGAFSNDRPIRTSRANTLRKSIVALGDYATGPKSTEKNEYRIALTTALASTVERIRMFGSAALDLAWVAEGRIDACVILSNKPWDTAAGVLIAKEAGALVTDSLGADHTFSSRTTIAASPAVSNELLGLITAAAPMALTDRGHGA